MINYSNILIGVIIINTKMTSNKQDKFMLFSKRNIKLKNIKEYFGEKLMFILSFFSAIIILILFIYIIKKSWKVFDFNGLDFIFNNNFDQQIFFAFIAPPGNPIWDFGIGGLIIGTLATTFGALLIAVPLGIGTAIVITELSPLWSRRFLKSLVNFLASLPSIVYGLLGLMVVVRFIRSFIDIELQSKYVSYCQLTGKSLLAGIIVLSFMILPIITSLTMDSLKSVPKSYKEASLALGLSHWRTIVKVIIPVASPGIITGIILATGTAVGESIAMSMVTGSVAKIPNPVTGFTGFIYPVLTLAAAIVNKSQTLSGESTSAVLFACGAVLLIACTVLSLSAKLVNYVVRRRLGLD